MKTLSVPTQSVVLLAAALLSSASLADSGVNRCGTLLTGKTQIHDQLIIPAGLDLHIEKFIASSTLIPGLVVAIVKDDTVVYARGFGYRDLEHCQPVDTETRFYLKSTTKTFLGMAAALLHEEGAINLDAPITEYLPELKLPEGLNASQVSLRDHFTHTQPYFDGGLNYRTAFPGNLPEEEFVNHVNEFSQAGDIGFRYSNFGPIMGAHAVNHHTGVNWRDLIQNRIFVPAGMDDSFTLISEAEKGPIATSYLQDERGNFVPTLTKNEAQMHAAGGAVSTASDLSRWIILNLNGGKIGGEQVFPRRAVEHAQARSVYLDADFMEFHRFAHGLGIYSADYEGDLLMHHFGGETHVSFMPEHGVGVVILSNAIADGGAVTHRLAATTYDILLGKPEIEARIAGRLMEIAERQESRAARMAVYLADLQSRADATSAEFTPGQLVGRYADPRLGEMAVKQSASGLEIVFGEIQSRLVPLGNAYLAHINLWGGPPELFVFRRGDSDRQVLDWGGRIFIQTADE